MGSAAHLKVSWKEQLPNRFVGHALLLRLQRQKKGGFSSENRA